MAGKTVGEVVRGRDVYYIRVEASVLDAVRYMAERDIGAVVVLDGDRVAGIFTERDLMKKVVVAGKDPTTTPVADAMTRSLVLCEAGESQAACHSRMINHKIRHLPVVEEGQFLGLVSLRDLLQEGLSQREEELRLINAYIHYVPPTLGGKGP
jgi:CBS domain-containing protein